ncbi:MAG: universal stress protein [Dehalococcoidia bacterium]
MSEAVHHTPSLRILVPFDDSPGAWRAALSVPALRPETVILLSVLEECPELSDVPAPSAAGAGGATPEAHELWRRLQEARGALERARERLFEEGWSGDCQLTLRCGKAGPEIVAVAGETCCGLIVMGAHRELGVRRPLLGEVARHVLRQFDGGGVTLVR